MALRLGWREEQGIDRSEHLTRHYSRVREEVAAREAEVLRVCDRDYIEKMQQGGRPGRAVEVGHPPVPQAGGLTAVGVFAT